LCKATFVKTSQITSALIVLILIVFFSCKKHSAPAPAAPSPKSYIANMAGTRVWHASLLHQCLLCSPVINIDSSAADTFAITVFDTSEIVVPLTAFTSFDTLYYYSENDTLNTITFNSGAASAYYNSYIVYYYLSDSIVYEAALSNPGDTIMANLHTP
jgi:hypothetical protein